MRPLCEPIDATTHFVQLIHKRDVQRADVDIQIGCLGIMR